MPLNDHEKDLIQAMFYDNCDVNTVSKVVPHAPRSTLYPHGAPRKITPLMREYLIDLLSEKNDLWQEELVFELWCQFDVVVDRLTISRLLKEEELSNKVNTRIASRQSNAQQGVYLEQLAELMGQGLDAGIDPMDMLVYLDESACSEKVIFRRRSWSQIGLPAYTRSELVGKTRCSVLPALDVYGYLYGSSVVVEGTVTQAMYEYWLEAVTLPQCEPFLGKRSIVIMDNCSTHHSDKVWSNFGENSIITDLGRQFGIHLLYLPPYSPHLNPIELTFHLLKQWLRRWRDLAPKPEDLEPADYKKAWILHLKQASSYMGPKGSRRQEPVRTQPNAIRSHDYYCSSWWSQGLRPTRVARKSLQTRLDYCYGEG
ncbi:hypothetical protein D6C78_10679 [Aureobasidium pullulans]|uniref:Tc1-like transposase DDE domain-containing protein n=1 Tax=Aureobasidium pullulans TaxID=5580 RepID=A0A4T0B3P3_AURPU|nr:hypothetical protein D6C78_10679 [Aureobasidium pullulans]